MILSFCFKVAVFNDLIGIKDREAGRMTVEGMASWVGLMQHARAVCLMPADMMWEYYAAWRADGESLLGPQAKVKHTARQSKMDAVWVRRLSSHAGCVVTDVLRTRHVDMSDMPKDTFIVRTASDACLTGAEVPGQGGWTHGLFWQYSLDSVEQRMPITMV